ncbi:MAG: cyclic nucleotide-binding domain-containing protein [Caldilineaceae bacterium]
MTIASQLQAIPLFSRLPKESVIKLVQQGTVHDYASHAVVVCEGEASDAMYVILAGEVRVFKRDEAAHEVDLNVQKAGECFGELALLDSQPRSATITCLTPCRLFRLEKAALMNLLLHPDTQSMALSILSLLVGRVRRVTEKYFAEQLAQRLLHAEMAVERHRSVAQMVAGVAHELNTPLGITNTAVAMIHKRVQSEQLMAVGDDNPAARRILCEIHEATALALRNIERAHKLIQNFKKVSVNHFVEERETVDLSVLVRDILELFEINARQAQLAIRLQDHLLPHQKQWTGYPGHFTQVLTNLLFNIERYAYPEQQGGGIAVEIAVDQGQKPPVFVVQVSDFGVGIAPPDLPRIFDPFFTTGRHKGGTGLGLAIARNLVTDALHGTIAVVSQPGKVTTFTVTFPQVIA